MSTIDPVALDRERARRGLYAFVRMAWDHVGEPGQFLPNWHLEAICQELEDLTSGALLRSVINVPPGTGKSMLTGVLWPAWIWISRPDDFPPGAQVGPDTRFMYASYDLSLMTRDAARLSNLLESEWFVARWGRLLEPNYQVRDLRLRAGGGRFSTSIGGKGLGRHAHYQPIDDPIKPQDAAGGAAVTGTVLESTWATIADTFASRAIVPDRFRRVIIMQRVHEDDPAARALAAGWHGLRLPMRAEVEDLDPRDQRTQEGTLLFPARFPEATVATLETTEPGPDVFATQYQQRPGRKGGSIWFDAWIREISLEDWEALGRKVRAIQSWDLAFKNAESSDWVAGQWWRQTFGDGPGGGSRYFLGPGPIHEPLSFVETVQRLEAQRAAWPAAEILIEDKANGPAVESVLRGKWPGVIRMVNPAGSKTARAHAVAPLWSSGSVHVVRGPWLDALRRLFSRFPRVRRDDPVDAASQALLDLSRGSAFSAAMAAVRKQ